jgi:hypothetical protein
VVQSSHDWLRSPLTSLLAWWIPQAAIFVGLFAPINVRTAIWIIALSWMGTACILNAKRCGRTHCRYTSPYYLAMIVPVVVLGSGFVSAGIKLGWYWQASLCSEANFFGGQPSVLGANSLKPKVQAPIALRRLLALFRSSMPRCSRSAALAMARKGYQTAVTPETRNKRTA